MNLAVGFFDGVHLGHRKILARADAALTFLEHPLAVLAPERAPALLMTSEERIAAIASALRNNGRDKVRALPFTRELADRSREDFAADLRRGYPELETIYCGPNWNFGAGGAGDADFLRAKGFAVETMPFEQHEGLPISSTRIRVALKSGDLPLANAMLGRPFSVCGEVVPGKGEGRRLGFPTINLRPANLDLARLLPFGVYVVDTEFGRGVANWGLAPTMGEQAWTEPMFEVHLVEGFEGFEGFERFEGVERVEGREKVGGGILLRRFLRPERRFASVEALREQIEADVFSASHST